MGAFMSASSSWWKTFQQRIHSLMIESSFFPVFSGPHQLCGAEMLESLQGSSKKCSRKGEEGNEDKDMNLKRKNLSNL
jgi:hypothetical protein